MIIKIILFLLFTPVLLFSNPYNNRQNQINGLDYQYILIHEQKIELKYSTITDVEKILGKPEKIEFRERGSTDFRWFNYTSYYYDNDKLIIDFSQNNYVISIQVLSDYSNDVVIFNENINMLNRDYIENFINNFRNSNISTSFQSIWLKLTIKQPNHSINYNGSILKFGFIFNSSGEIRLFTLYYDAPWE